MINKAVTILCFKTQYYFKTKDDGRHNLMVKHIKAIPFTKKCNDFLHKSIFFLTRS